MHNKTIDIMQGCECSTVKYRAGQYKWLVQQSVHSLCGWISVLTESPRQDTTCCFHHWRDIHAYKMAVSFFCHLNEGAQVKFTVVMKWKTVTRFTAMRKGCTLSTDGGKELVTCGWDVLHSGWQELEAVRTRVENCRVKMKEKRFVGSGQERHLEEVGWVWGKCFPAG